MLPPFVPPSARVPKEPLPLITEFVIERTESVAVAEPPEAPQPAEASAPPRAWTSDSEIPLPSIDEFVIRRSESERPVAAAAAPVPPEIEPEPEAPAASATSEAAPEARSEPSGAEQGEGAPAQEAPTEVEAALATSVQDEPALPAAEETPPGAVFNDESGKVEASTPGVSAEEAWAASSMSAAALGAESVEQPTPAAAPGAPAEEWVADERDAFDWQRMSGLAASPDEARRAADDWAATSWDRGHKSEHEHVAAALVQIARRIRAGELKVEVPQQATAEASLAAVLAALLADSDR